MSTSPVEKKKRGRLRTRKSTQNSLATSDAVPTSVIIRNKICGESSSRKPAAGENLLQKSISETYLFVKETLMIKQSRIKKLEDELNEQRKSNACLTVLSRNLQSQVEDKDQRVKEVVRERTSSLKTLAEKLNMEIESERGVKEGYVSQVEDLKALAESLGKKVKDQEYLSNELQHVNEERANFMIVNKELQETLLSQQESHEGISLTLKMEMKTKEANLLEKDKTLSKEKECVKRQKKYIEILKSDLNKTKEDSEKLREELGKKHLEMERAMNILNYNLKEEKFAVINYNKELEICRSKINDMTVKIKSFETKADEYQKRESLSKEAVKSAEITIEKLGNDMKSQEDVIASLNLDHGHHVSLLSQKEECIKDLQQKLKAAEIIGTLKDNQKRVDKLIITQKQEEIEQLKADRCTCAYPRKRKNTDSAKNGTKVAKKVDMYRDIELVTELPPIAEVKGSDDSDRSSVEQCSVRKPQVQEPNKSSKISANGGKLVASLDKAMSLLRSRQPKAKNLPRTGDRVDVELESNEVDGSSENKKESEEDSENIEKEESVAQFKRTEDERDTELRFFIHEFDHALPSTSGEVRVVKDVSKLVNPKKQQNSVHRLPTSPPPDYHQQIVPASPTQSLAPPLVSFSPAQTSQKAETPSIRVRDVDTMRSLVNHEQLGGLLIPPPVTISDVGDIIPVDMDIVSDQEVVQIRLQEEERKRRFLEAEKKLKHEVAGVVKSRIENYYVSPHHSVPPGKGFLVHCSEEFSKLVRWFSWQFREEIIREHNLTHSSVEWIEVSQQHKQDMAEQIHLYFKVREEVHLKLERVLSCSDPGFSTLFCQLTECLWRELTEPHWSRVGSLQSLVMTEDVRLYIRNMVERNFTRYKAI